MRLLLNLLIIAIIIGLAAYQIYRHIHQSRRGRCAACEYDCEIKRLAKHKTPLE